MGNPVKLSIKVFISIPPEAVVLGLKKDKRAILTSALVKWEISVSI